MAKAQGNTASRSSAGSTDWVLVGKGLNMIHVTSTGWNSASATLEMSKDGEDANAGNVYQSNEVVVFTENRSRLIYSDGEAWIRLTITGSPSADVVLETRTVSVAQTFSSVR